MKFVNVLKKEIITFFKCAPNFSFWDCRRNEAKVAEQHCRGITRAEGGHSAAGQVPVCWSLDINRTALYAHAVLPASRDAFFPEKY
jgi:acid phosphatase class B